MMQFVGSSLFIPVLILFLAATISIVVISVHGKKKTPPKEERHEYTDNVVVNTPVVPQTEVVPKAAEVAVQEVKQTYTTPLPTVDIPIPKIDDTPIVVDRSVSINDENPNESIKVEYRNPIIEHNVNIDEIVHIDNPQTITNEVDESVNIEMPKPLVNDVGENISIEESRPILNEQNDEVQIDAPEVKVEDTNLVQVKPIETVSNTAFGSVPSGDQSINTDIQVDNNEYVSNKTEVLNLNEIQNEIKRI